MDVISKRIFKTQISALRRTAPNCQTTSRHILLLISLHKSVHWGFHDTVDLFVSSILWPQVHFLTKLPMLCFWYRLFRWNFTYIWHWIAKTENEQKRSRGWPIFRKTCRKASKRGVGKVLVAGNWMQIDCHLLSRAKVMTSSAVLKWSISEIFS